MLAHQLSVMPDPEDRITCIDTRHISGTRMQERKKKSSEKKLKTKHKILSPTANRFVFIFSNLKASDHCKLLGIWQSFIRTKKDKSLQASSCQGCTVNQNGNKNPCSNLRSRLLGTWKSVDRYYGTADLDVAGSTFLFCLWGKPSVYSIVLPEMQILLPQSHGNN